jgi:hypothetical protein
VNIAPVKPPVRVKEPGSKLFVPLAVPTQVRVGSIIDTTKGRVRITIEDAKLRLDTADFYEGLFKITQLSKGSKLATLELNGGRFTGCAKAPKVRLSRKKLSVTRSVRHLWGTGAAASIRGTSWLTDDRCNGTLTRVKQGSVSVRDFVKKKTVVVKAPKKYLARPKARRR